MEKREVSIQWGSVVIVVAVMAFSMMGVQYYSQNQLAARVRDAGTYLAQNKETKGRDILAFYKKTNEKSVLQGRLKQATDDIGEQYDPRYVNSSVLQTLYVNSESTIRIQEDANGNQWTNRVDTSSTSEVKRGYTAVGTVQP